MSIILSLVAPAAFALAQAKDVPAPPLPPVKPAPPLVYAPAPPPVSIRSGSGPCPDLEQPRVSVQGGYAAICITRVEGRPALVTIDAIGEQVGRASEIDVATAIAILADTRLEPFWPEMEALLGENGSALREAGLTRARDAYRRGRATSLSASRATMESMNDADNRAILDLARALDVAGRLDEALALLDEELPRPRAGRTTLSDSRQYDRLSNRLRHAQLLYNNRRHEEALASLAALENDPLIAADYRINATVNRAAFLAELGRGAEALAAIDRAVAAFGSPGDAYRIEGSGRQFAWIRACALHLLGRADESAAAMAVVDAAPERIASTWASVPTTSSIGFRAALCLGNVDRIADVIGGYGDYGYPYPYGHMLQGDWQPALAANRQLVAAAVERLAARGVVLPVRQIPDRYRQALAFRNAQGASGDTSPAQP
jgi:tetratricopeptide (TPR) repeat protein